MTGEEVDELLKSVLIGSKVSLNPNYRISSDVNIISCKSFTILSH